jgi:hypothetical protein
VPSHQSAAATLAMPLRHLTPGQSPESSQSRPEVGTGLPEPLATLAKSPSNTMPCGGLWASELAHTRGDGLMRPSRSFDRCPLYRNQLAVPSMSSCHAVGELDQQIDCRPEPFAGSDLDVTSMRARHVLGCAAATIHHGQSLPCLSGKADGGRTTGPR